MQALAMVSHNGNVFWPPIVKFKGACEVQIKYFPFDDQVCYNDYSNNISEMILYCFFYLYILIIIYLRILIYTYIYLLYIPNYIYIIYIHYVGTYWQKA